MWLWCIGNPANWAIEAVVKAVSDEEVAASMYTIREAEEEGSEFATLLQLMCYEDADIQSFALQTRRGKQTPIFTDILHFS